MRSDQTDAVEIDHGRNVMPLVLGQLLHVMTRAASTVKLAAECDEDQCVIHRNRSNRFGEDGEHGGATPVVEGSGASAMIVVRSDDDGVGTGAWDGADHVGQVGVGLLNLETVRGTLSRFHEELTQTFGAIFV